MPEAVHGRRVGARRLDVLVVVVVVGELPVLHAVDRRPADLDRPPLADERDRSLEVPRVGQDGHLEHADGAGGELKDGRAGVLGLDPAGQRRRPGDDAPGRAEEPLHEVDVVRGLVHDRAGVERPRPPPRRLVVVLLWARPPHRRVGEEDPAEAPLVDRAPEEPDGGVQAVLLDDEELDARPGAGLDERIGPGEGDRHRLLGDDVLPRPRREDAVLRMEPRRCADGDHVALRPGEHLVVCGVPRDSVLLPGSPRPFGDLVAHRRQAQPGDLAQGVEVVAADPTAPDQRHRELASRAHAPARRSPSPSRS
jgi:hypothetical protein